MGLSRGIASSSRCRNCLLSIDCTPFYFLPATASLSFIAIVFLPPPLSLLSFLLPAPPWLAAAVGEQLALQLSAAGARLILSGLPAEEAAMVELRQRLAREEGVR